MSQDASLLSSVKAELAGLTDELRDLAAARLELLRLEAKASARALRRLVVGLVAAGVMALVALAVLVASLGQLLDGRAGLSASEWLALLGCGLLGFGAFTGWFSYRRFLRQFRGLEDSLDELREDLVWLAERAKPSPREHASAPGDATSHVAASHDDGELSK